MGAWLSYLTVSLVWGSTFLGIAYAVDAFTPFGLSAARFLPAGLIALILARLRGERMPSRRELGPLMGQGALLLALCMALLAWAEGRVSSGVAATLGATVPLFLGAQEPRGLGPKGWLGLGVGFLGVAVLLWPGGRGPDLLGAGVLVLSAFIWSFGTLYGKRHPCGAGHFSQVAVEMLTAGLLSLAAAPWAGGFTHGPVGRPSLLALAYLILAGSIVAYSAYHHLTRAWPAARAGTYAYWNPVVAVVLGWAVRHEAIPARMVPGLVLILAGVLLVQIPWPPRPARRA
ncbi:EamA family transporter [Mesoterricola sediminis]|uniref:Drug/metabolite exporter YedA n=1 Tax=Mesoterricola sediminis TaxID=2927980 RepID=A0AA48GXK5_9BACT|nr:EamA family transporter [Mesoterricola sediminis]BDU78134.1 drug/metabolite exporter YedA [Mesoterricola sediminis]